MQQSGFAPGFRVSVTDIFVLIAGTGGSIALWMMTWWWGFVVAFVLGHFFLFCNIVRLARPLELAWGAIFVALTSANIAFEFPEWPITIAGSLIATAVVVVIEMCKPSYHGVGWQRINPDLPTWWETHGSH